MEPQRGKRGSEGKRKGRDTPIFQTNHCPWQLLKMGSRDLRSALRQLRSYILLKNSWLCHCCYMMKKFNVYCLAVVELFVTSVMDGQQR